MWTYKWWHVLWCRRAVGAGSNHGSSSQRGHLPNPALFSHRHRLPEVPFPTVCQVQPLSPVLHRSRSEDIHLQLLEWWEFKTNLLNFRFKPLHWTVWTLTFVFQVRVKVMWDSVSNIHLFLLLLLQLADPHHRDLYVNSSDYLALLNDERANPNATGQHIVAQAFHGLTKEEREKHIWHNMYNCTCR